MTSPKPHWHWPRFEQVLCGEMTDRERLGLPDCFISTALAKSLDGAYSRLRSTSLERLLEILSNREYSLAERIASGNLLALFGDPRIDTLHPEMIDITAGVVEVGLRTEAIDNVLESYSGLGLDRSWIEKECPRHSLTLAPYRLAQFPVTNLEYRDFLLATGHYEIPSSWYFRQFPIERANHPVYTVSPESADAYVQWLAKLTGRNFRLPTEAEWEWAATGPDGREFPWGQDFDADLANTAESGLLQSSPVGAFVGGGSPFGIADMAGNVEEYVSDDYAAYPGGEFVTDHLVQIHGRYRVARGGSFARCRDLARTRRRHGHNPRSVTYAMGFRLAESI